MEVVLSIIVVYRY